MNKVFKNRAGFTFIELIIYIAIVSVFLVLISNFAWDIIQGDAKTASYREVQQNARFAMEKIIRTLRDGSNPNSFSVLDGVLYQNGIAITTEQVKVTDFGIVPISNTYKINLTIEHNNPENRIEYEASIDLESTVALVAGGALPSNLCWGTGGSCNLACQYTDYGGLTNYYTDPGCSELCSSAGSFYIRPDGTCSDDGTGFCYKMDNPLTQYTVCSQGNSCEGSCSGTCTPCRQIRNEEQCNQQDGCSWFIRRCFDFPGCTSCDGYTEENPCLGQLGCDWNSTKWYWVLDNLQNGHSSFTTCEWYE